MSILIGALKALFRMLKRLVATAFVSAPFLGGGGYSWFEEIPYDTSGQPSASTFADYHWPGPTSLPNFRISHMVTPAEGTEYGMKGMGEGGAIAPPAAVANAARDALLSAGIDAKISETPMTPRRIYDAIQAALTTRR